jgi:two-component system chemotaxis response regulator CheY
MDLINSCAKRLMTFYYGYAFFWLLKQGKDFLSDGNPNKMIKVLSVNDPGIEKCRGLIQNPDCIIIDINVPVMDGIALLTLIKEDNNLKNIPASIFTTTNGENETAKVRRLGAEFIQKKSYYTELVDVIRKIASDLMRSI